MRVLTSWVGRDRDRVRQGILLLKAGAEFPSRTRQTQSEMELRGEDSSFCFVESVQLLSVFAKAVAPREFEATGGMQGRAGRLPEEGHSGSKAQTEPEPEPGSLSLGRCEARYR